MPGFRPGKVPVSLLRKQYGRSVMGEVLEQAVNQGSQKAISEHELRPALRPKIEVTSFDEGADLEFTMALEVLPEVPRGRSQGDRADPPGRRRSTTRRSARRSTTSPSASQEFAPPAEPRPEPGAAIA